MPTRASIPVVDVSADAATVAGDVDAACREVGFFGVVGHGVPAEVFDALDIAARAFFALPDETKADVAMDRAGAAWRGWFPVGRELTDGVADLKEGFYVGADHADDHPLARAGTPLHGRNRFPAEPAGFGPAVTAWMTAMRPLAETLLRRIAVGLGRDPDWFELHLTTEPTELFRIFHYPPGDARSWGVAEHTDYGLVTLLAQDDVGGLEVRAVDGAWITVEPTADMLVCNLGDMLQVVSNGRYRSTAHRVRNRSDVGRFSYPYFFDPDWHATVPGTAITYGDYITDKVSRVFPELFARSAARSEREVTGAGPSPRSPSADPRG